MSGTEEFNPRYFSSPVIDRRANQDISLFSINEDTDVDLHLNDILDPNQLFHDELGDDSIPIKTSRRSGGLSNNANINNISSKASPNKGSPLKRLTNDYQDHMTRARSNPNSPIKSRTNNRDGDRIGIGRNILNDLKGLEKNKIEIRPDDNRRNENATGALDDIRMSSLKHENDNLKNQNKELQHEIQQLKTELDAAHDLKDEQDRRIDRLEAQVSTKLNELTKLKNENRKQLEEIDRLKNENRKLLNEKDGRDNKDRQLFNENKKLRDENGRLSSEIGKLNSEIKKTNATLTVRIRENDLLREKLRKYKTLYDASQKPKENKVKINDSKLEKAPTSPPGINISNPLNKEDFETLERLLKQLGFTISKSQARPVISPSIPPSVQQQSTEKKHESVTSLNNDQLPNQPPIQLVQSHVDTHSPYHSSNQFSTSPQQHSSQGQSYSQPYVQPSQRNNQTLNQPPICTHCNNHLGSASSTGNQGQNMPPVQSTFVDGASSVQNAPASSHQAPSQSRHMYQNQSAPQPGFQKYQEVNHSQNNTQSPQRGVDIINIPQYAQQPRQQPGQPVNPSSVRDNLNSSTHSANYHISPASVPMTESSNYQETYAEVHPVGTQASSIPTTLDRGQGDANFNPPTRNTSVHSVQNGAMPAAQNSNPTSSAPIPQKSYIPTANEPMTRTLNEEVDHPGLEILQDSGVNVQRIPKKNLSIHGHIGDKNPTDATDTKPTQDAGIHDECHSQTKTPTQGEKHRVIVEFRGLHGDTCSRCEVCLSEKKKKNSSEGEGCYSCKHRDDGDDMTREFCDLISWRDFNE